MVQLWAADFSWAQLTVAELQTAGYSGAIRYVIGAGKQVTPDEFHTLTTTPGFSLALVNETTAQAAQGGYQVGRAEAFAAFGRADTLGWPNTRPIYFVCEDPNWLTEPSWAAIEQYLEGVASVVPVARIGDYGSAQQIAHMMTLGLCTYGWAVETWPGDESRCHLQQRYNPYPGAPHNFNGQVDPDMILQPDWGQWTSVISVPTQKEDDVAVFQYAHQEHTVMVDMAGNLIHRWVVSAKPGLPLPPWGREVRATGCIPGAVVGVDMAFNGQLHLYANRPDGQQTHCWYAPGSGWKTEVLA